MAQWRRCCWAPRRSPRSRIIRPPPERPRPRPRLLPGISARASCRISASRAPLPGVPRSRRQPRRLPRRRLSGIRKLEMLLALARFVRSPPAPLGRRPDSQEPRRPRRRIRSRSARRSVNRQLPQRPPPPRRHSLPRHRCRRRRSRHLAASRLCRGSRRCSFSGQAPSSILAASAGAKAMQRTESASFSPRRSHCRAHRQTLESRLRHRARRRLPAPRLRLLPRLCRGAV